MLPVIFQAYAECSDLEHALQAPGRLFYSNLYSEALDALHEA